MSMPAAEAGFISTTITSPEYLSSFDPQGPLPRGQTPNEIAGDIEESAKTDDVPHSERKAQSNLKLSIETIIMSALIFIAILSWFEFLRAAYDNVFAIEGHTPRYDFILNRFWYAMFISCLAFVLIYVIYRITVGHQTLHNLFFG